MDPEVGKLIQAIQIRVGWRRIYRRGVRTRRSKRGHWASGIHLVCQPVRKHDVGNAGHTATSLLTDGVDASERSERAEIAGLLREWTLGEGEVPVEEARTRLKRMGYEVSQKTIGRAATDAGLAPSKPSGMGGKRSYVRAASPASLDDPSDPVVSCPDFATEATRENAHKVPSVDSGPNLSRLSDSESSLSLTPEHPWLVSDLLLCIGCATETPRRDDDGRP
jgi:hypothetical protein